MTEQSMAEHSVKTPRGHVVSNRPIARLLFDDTRLAWEWLILRVLVGLTWIEAASHKLGDPAWMQTGEALKKFWANAVKVPDTGLPPITFDWYRSFIQSMLDAQSYVWFAKLVAIGDLLVVVCLVLRLFAHISAFFG